MHLSQSDGPHETGSGHDDLDEAYSGGYTETVPGVKRTFGAFTLAVAYTGTNGGTDIFGNLGDDRLLATSSFDF
jgi:hypothetical protein